MLKKINPPFDFAKLIKEGSRGHLLVHKKMFKVFIMCWFEESKISETEERRKRIERMLGMKKKGKT